jgi:hypothetical protein
MALIMSWIFMTDFLTGGGKLKWLRIVGYAGRSVIFAFAVALQNNSHPGRFIFRSSDHTQLHTHARARAVGLLCTISMSLRPITTQHTTNTTYEHLYSERDANTRPQKSSGCIPTP